MKAVVLLSGGLDSATVLAMLLDRGHTVETISFSYGQRHATPELHAAYKLARHYRVEHVMFKLPTPGRSSLVGTEEVPAAGTTPEGKLPTTYVPARNLVMLAVAVQHAMCISADVVAIGANAVDYSGYPDCRPEFISSFNRAVATGCEPAPSVAAPLVLMSKAEIITEGARLNVPFDMTWSCYDPQAVEGTTPQDDTPRVRACGRCDSCAIRCRGFQDAQVPDPTRYT